MSTQTTTERPEEVHSVRENYPELSSTNGRPFVPARTLHTDYPLIDSDPHFRRVIAYARPSDYLAGTIFAAFAPTAMLLMERMSPSEVGKGGFSSIMRLTGGLGLASGFYLLYSRSQNRFYGFSENRREIEKDMREMTDKVKRGEPLYGHGVDTAKYYRNAERELEAEGGRA
ncbi:hypothetical protein LTR17_013981 [Elasticomyces elasticus]|nr:hypothetical protein LTR17_013981 [Elasticomyces elasticus]